MNLSEIPENGEPLPKGGSGRMFSRVQLNAENATANVKNATAILCRYDDSREENALYADIAVFLRESGFPVPAILAHDPATRRLLLEDLGIADIASLADAPWLERREAYFSALDALKILHGSVSRKFLELPPAVRPRLMPSFDRALYRWEQDYFRQHCYERLAANANRAGKPDAEIPDFSICAAELHALTERLLAHPRALVHRDCQSENILWRDNHAWFIDFQGLRLGSAWYDVASLIQDPYAKLSAEQRRELFNYYASENATVDASADVPTAAPNSSIQNYLDASAQRLMQALGAYGFLGVQKNRPAFLRHTAPALENLVSATAQNPHLPALHRVAAALLRYSAR